MAPSITSLATESAVLTSGRWPHLGESPYDGVGGMRIDPLQLPGPTNPGWDVSSAVMALVDIGFVARLGYRALWFHFDRAVVEANWLDDGQFEATIGGAAMAYYALSDPAASWAEWQTKLQAKWQADLAGYYSGGASVQWYGDSVCVSVPSGDPLKMPTLDSVGMEGASLLGIQAEVRGASAQVYGRPKFTRPTPLLPVAPDNWLAIVGAWKGLRNLGAIPESGYIELINVAPLSHVHIVLTGVILWPDTVTPGPLYAATVIPSRVP